MPQRPANAVTRLEEALGRLPARRRYALAAMLGGLGALSLSPHFLTPLLFVSFSGLVWLLERTPSLRRCLVIGWFFGLSYFAVGLSWIAESFYVDAERFGAFAIPAVTALSAFLALFPALACLGAGALREKGWRLLLAFAISWSAAEWLRGHLLTGFPWNLTGYAWGVTDETLQVAAFTGIYGLSLLTTIIAGLPALAFSNQPKQARARWTPVALAVVCIGALWSFGWFRLSAASPATDVPGVRLRIVQGNIPQSLKWKPAERERILKRYLSLSLQPAETPPTHIIWPETAVPYLLGEDAELRLLLARAAPEGGALLTGAVRRAPDFETAPSLRNSIVALNPAGIVVAAYDKVRLVPFGEYVPLRKLLPIPKLTEGSVEYSPGDGRNVLSIPGLPPLGALICYEAIFPGISWREGRPRWLLNVTNDGWFGLSSGPHQHFLAARVRSIEQGLPLVRAAYTGISAVVDAYGRVRSSLPLNSMGVLDAALPEALAEPTWYGRLGDWPFAFAMSFLFSVSMWRPLVRTLPR